MIPIILAVTIKLAIKAIRPSIKLILQAIKAIRPAIKLNLQAIKAIRPAINKKGMSLTQWKGKGNRCQ
jgi:hypothetical protein